MITVREICFSTLLSWYATTSNWTSSFLIVTFGISPAHVKTPEDLPISKQSCKKKCKCWWQIFAFCTKNWIKIDITISFKETDTTENVIVSPLIHSVSPNLSDKSSCLQLKFKKFWISPYNLKLVFQFWILWLHQYLCPHPWQLWWIVLDFQQGKSLKCIVNKPVRMCCLGPNSNKIVPQISFSSNQATFWAKYYSIQGIHNCWGMAWSLVQVR